MKNIIRLYPPVILLSLVATLLVAACNKKGDPDENYQTDSSVAVTKMYLKPNISVMANLDSVFFSIDLNRGVIFNADSLPKGTNVTKLVPVITYPSRVKSATIEMTGGKVRTGKVDYKKNPSDSIDFTGKVVLTLVAEDGESTRSYDLKVNVHNMDPDSLMWDKVAVSTLPSRKPVPMDQRTLLFRDKVHTLIAESDGTYTLAVSSDPATDQWTRSEIQLPLGADVRSFAASATTLYLLDGTGELCSSSDGLTWTGTGETWHSIIGGYGDYVTGLRKDSGKFYHTIWPHDAGYAGAEVEDGFPVTDTSDFVTFTNKWSVHPVGFMTGGRDSEGNPNPLTWGFDGDTWTSISVKTPPAIMGATVVPYYFYRKTSAQWIQKEMNVWLLLGGKLADGSMNRKVYISYDNGVNWQVASTSLQMPDYFPAMTGCDQVVVSSGKEGSLTANWTRMGGMKTPPGMRRITYEIDGYDIAWECPYIYLFGGRDEKGVLCNTVWRGVLNRLTFMPLI